MDRTELRLKLLELVYPGSAMTGDQLRAEIDGLEMIVNGTDSSDAVVLGIQVGNETVTLGSTQRLSS